MSLSRVDKERINDSRLKIQSITDTLGEVDPEKVPCLDEIQECLADAEKTLTKALRKQA